MSVAGRQMLAENSLFPAEPGLRSIARDLYDHIRDHPLICPHAHTDRVELLAVIIFGLPRIVSGLEDIEWIFDAYDSPANGLTFCSGSLEAGPHNDLPRSLRCCAARVHFAHLRNVTRDPDGSFAEAVHLGGDNPMPEIVDLLLREEARRHDEGQSAEIPFRPDHGHRLLGDLTRDAHPDYPLTGRMRGLAELRGVIAALNYHHAKE